MNIDKIRNRLVRYCACYANWTQGKLPVSYKMEIRFKNQTHEIPIASSPFTMDTFGDLLESWKINRLNHYAIAILYVLAMVPIVARYPEDKLVETDINLENALATLPEELLAELYLEGFLND